MKNPEGYVADPRKGGLHTRGAAVDLTLVYLENLGEVEMPTAFDDFTRRAHVDYNNLPDNQKKNRELLRSVMEKYGFDVNPYEWWHFNHKLLPVFTNGYRFC